MKKRVRVEFFLETDEYKMPGGTDDREVMSLVDEMLNGEADWPLNAMHQPKITLDPPAAALILTNCKEVETWGFYGKVIEWVGTPGVTLLSDERSQKQHHKLVKEHIAKHEKEIAKLKKDQTALETTYPHLVEPINGPYHSDSW